MSTSRALISVEEYLSTVYEEGDCDYVDGEVLDRAVGTRDHSWFQGMLAAYFIARRKEWNITILPEIHIRVSATRYRIPDLAILLGDTDEQILTKPPFLCIEILSPEDRWSRVESRINDFLKMGVAYVWVIDPQTRQIYVATAAAGLHEVKDGVLRTSNPEFCVALDELYA
jgi:Uma2 family endonuclease